MLKKLNYRFVFSVLLTSIGVFGTMSGQMQDIQLSGAATSVVNGTYTYMGQHTTGDGWGGSFAADYYQKGSIYIYRLSFRDWPGGPVNHWWRIGSSLGANGSNQIYYTVGSTQTHPVGLTFSIASGLGTSPGPTAELGVNVWNGSSWSTGSAPSGSDDVTLSSSTGPGSFTARNLELENGVDLTIAQGETVTISGNISGQAPIDFDGSLQNFSLSGTTSNWISGAAGTFSGAGTPANALNFDGSDDYVSIAHNAAFDYSSGFTVEAWVKADALTNHGALVSKFANSNREFSVLLLNTGVVEYSISFNGSTEQYFNGNTTLNAGTWYHIALTYDGSTMRAYLNGVADGTKSVSGSIRVGSSPLYIGARSEGSLSRFFDGTIDEVRIWTTTRSQADIQGNMNSELSGNETGLLAYYNFNQGTPGGSNGTETTLNNNSVSTYDPNVINGGGTLIFDNNGETLTLDNLKVNMTGVVQVTTGTTLQTNDSLTLIASSASSYGQLIGDGTVLGNVAAQAWVDVSTARYHDLGAPFTNATLQEFNEGQTMVAANSSQGTVWFWDANNAQWAAPSALTDVAGNGRGYSIYAGTNAYGTFLMNANGASEVNGTLASGDIQVALGYNDGQSASVGFAGGTSQSSTEGWNFLANPYPSQYDWDGQALATGMSNAFYVNKGGVYASYVNGVGTNGGTQYLAPFQGFWVQTSSNSPGNFTFEQDQRVTAPSTSLLKTSVVDGVWLTVGDSIRSDELFIGFDHNASVGFDQDVDAHKLLNKDAPNVYTTVNGSAFSINRVAPNTQTSFPLELSNVADGQFYSFHLDASLLQGYTTVLLEDKMLSTWHDLKPGDYHFAYNKSYGSGRFVLHFAQSSVGLEKAQSMAGVYAYTDARGIHLDLNTLRDANVELYSLSGQLIDRQEEQNGEVHFPVGKKGVYLLRVMSKTAIQTLKVIR
jgi:hypothetical protein